MPKRKTKYTVRSDGRIVMTEIIDGRRKYFYGQTDREVEKKRDEYLQQLSALKESGRLFELVADQWWEEKEPRLSPNSISTYKGCYEKAVAAFGKLGIRSITPRMVYQYLLEYSMKDYSQKVISRHKSVLQAIFDYAFVLGEVDSNPCTTLPPIKGKPKVMREPAADEDIRKLEACKTESNIGRMMYFMLYTGCRRGEAAALQYKHLDRANNKASIVQSVAFGNDSRPYLKSPKTEAGKRTVIVPDRVLEIIPECSDPEQFVFFPSGLPNQHDVERGLSRFQHDHGINATAHQLRHSYASKLHTLGVDAKDAQKLLGHSSVELTLDIYTHLENAKLDQLSDKLSKL